MMSIALVLVATVAVTQGNYGEDSIPPDYWRNSRRCGTNCLYAYLSIHGRAARLKTISDRVPIGVDGANMADMRRAATDLGVPSQVVRTTRSRLSNYPLPAIAHLQSRDGHFVLILQVTPDIVTTADMLKGNVETIPADIFFELWSGYLLVPVSASHAWIWTLLATGLVAIAGLGFYRKQQGNGISEVKI